MNVVRSASFTLNGYPISVIKNERGDFGAFDGEGQFYLFNRIGAQQGLQRLSKIGFSEAFEFENFSILKGLDGKCFFSDFQMPLVDILSKFSSPCYWNKHLFFVNNKKLYRWSFKKDFPTAVNQFSNVEKIWVCGELLLIVTHGQWFVLKTDGTFELLSNNIFPFTSCTFLPKNNTFHFVLPMGEIGLINLSARLTEPYVTQATGNGLKIIGTSHNDKVAFSYFNQLIYMKAESLKVDEYTTITVDNLPNEPIRVIPHVFMPMFLVQEDARTVAIWQADEGNCLWRSSFDSEICYLKFRQNDFVIGCENGFIASFDF